MYFLSLYVLIHAFYDGILQNRILDYPFFLARPHKLQADIIKGVTSGPMVAGIYFGKITAIFSVETNI